MEQLTKPMEGQFDCQVTTVDQLRNAYETCA